MEMGKDRHEEALARIARFRVMDDTFMRQVFRDDAPLTQRALRTLTGRRDLVVVESGTQRDLKSMTGSRSVVLDVWARDAAGALHDLEVQRGTTVDARRLRFHSAAMDVDFMRPRTPFSALPEQWVIMVIERDARGGATGRRTFENRDADGNLLGDGCRKLVVDGSYRGDDELGRLMADFCEADPTRISDGMLRERVQWLKESEEGVSHMCEIMEEALRERELETKYAATLTHARSAMAQVGCSAERALEILGVARDEWGLYLPELRAQPVA